MAVTGSITLSASAKQTPTTPPDLGSPQDKMSLSLAAALALTNGIGAAQADRVWTDQRNLAASGTEDLDLAGAALLDPYGVAVVFAKIKALVIQALPANINNVVVGAAAANPWAGLLNATGTITLRPGETFAAFCGAADANGHTVTAGTGDLLKIANSGAGTAVDYKIWVIGTSA